LIVDVRIDSLRLMHMIRKFIFGNVISFR
jgi:hypothetical protein